MKRFSGRWPVCVLLCLLLGLWLCLPAAAAGAETTAPAGGSDARPDAAGETDAFTRDLLSHFRDSVPEGVREGLPDLCDPDALAGAVSPSALFTLVGEALGKGVQTLAPFLRGAVAVLIAAIVVGTLAPPGGIAAGAVEMGGMLLLYGALEGTFTRALTYLSDLSSFAGGLTPVFTALYVAGGNTSAAVSAASGLSIFCGVCAALGERVLSPLLRILLCLSLLCVLSGFSMLEELTKTVRGWAMTLFGLFSVLFPAAVGFQTNLLHASDSLAARGARYAVGSAIPVVGGALSGTLGTLTASLNLLRATVGTGGFLAVLGMALPVLAELLLCRMALSLAGALAGLCPGGAGGLFRRVGGVLDLLLAAVACACVLLLFLLVLLCRCAPAIAG